MKLIRPDYNISSYPPGKSGVFLAGPIQGAPHWNDWLIGELADMDVLIFDPRRDSMDGFDYAGQVAWETEHILRADVVAFSFVLPIEDVPGRSYAQTSRFELGECLARAEYGKTGQGIAVFVEGGFPGARYFDAKVNGEYPDVAVLNTEWKEHVAAVRRMIRSVPVGSNTLL